MNRSIAAYSSIKESFLQSFSHSRNLRLFCFVSSIWRVCINAYIWCAFNCFRMWTYQMRLWKDMETGYGEIWREIKREKMRADDSIWCFLFVDVVVIMTFELSCTFCPKRYACSTCSNAAVIIISNINLIHLHPEKFLRVYKTHAAPEWKEKKHCKRKIALERFVKS